MRDKNAPQTIAADAAGIARAAAILERGGLVAVPTETVYGLAARADSESAVMRIFAAKGRPRFNPLIVHVRDWEEAQKWGEFPDPARAIAHSMWPGPLTLVVPQRQPAQLPAAVTAHLDTIALRCPAHPVMAALLDAVDFPLAAPSANCSGMLSPTTADHVAMSLGERVDMILDGGPCSGGLESTILAIRADGTIEELRAGPIDTQGLQDRLHSAAPASGGAVDAARVDALRIEAPGQLSSHYSPGKPLRLNALHARESECLIGFGAVAGQWNLSASGDLQEAASNLYAVLHEAARRSASCIAVAPIPMEGIGRAINDRLMRAAAEREF